MKEQECDRQEGGKKERRRKGVNEKGRKILTGQHQCLMRAGMYKMNLLCCVSLH